MKMFKKRIMAALALIICMQHAYGNIFTNIIKTLVGYGAEKVEQGIAYVDQIWFNVEQDLHRPMEKAMSLYNQLESNKKHIALHSNDEGFPKDIMHADEAEKGIKNLLYLLENKIVTFDDAKKRLHCFKTGTYSTVDQAADATDLQNIINTSLTEVKDIENILKPILQKTYARHTDKTLFDMIRGHEHNSSFVQKKANEIKSFLWAKLCNNNTAAVKQLMDKETQDKAITDITDAFNKTIADEKDTTKKKEIIAQKDALTVSVRNTKTVCAALDMYVTINDMIQFLTTLQSPFITIALIQNACKEYHAMINAHHKITEGKEVIKTDSLILFVDNNAQFTHELLTNRSVVVAQHMQDGLVNGQLVDPTVSNAKLFINNYTLVKNSVLRLVSKVLTDINKIKVAYNSLAHIGTERIVMPRLGSKTVAGHFAAATLTTHDEYMSFAADLTKLIKTVACKANTPIHLLEKYATDITQYAELVSLERRLELLEAMCNGTGTVTQLDKLLENDKKISTAYTSFKKQQAVFDKNQSVSKLQLNSDDITLDMLVADRGTTFDALKQRMNVQKATSWNAASKIVTAGENAYAGYTDLLGSCNQLLNLTGGFDFDVLINRSLRQHTQVIVAKAIDADNNGKESVLEDLDSLYQAFIAAINKGNFTDKARNVIKEVADVYLKNIQPALKAQVIAAWYTHDIAWKMENATVHGLKGSVLEGLRKLTPTCGRSATLEMIG